MAIQATRYSGSLVIKVALLENNRSIRRNDYLVRIFHRGKRLWRDTVSMPAEKLASDSRLAFTKAAQSALNFASYDSNDISYDAAEEIQQYAEHARGDRPGNLFRVRTEPRRIAYRQGRKTNPSRAATANLVRELIKLRRWKSQEQKEFVRDRLLEDERFREQFEKEIAAAVFNGEQVFVSLKELVRPSKRITRKHPTATRGLITRYPFTSSIQNEKPKHKQWIEVYDGVTKRDPRRRRRRRK